MRDTIILGSGNWAKVGLLYYQTVIFQKVVSEATVKILDSATNEHKAVFFDSEIAINSIDGNVVKFQATKLPSISIPVEIAYSELPENVRNVVIEPTLTDGTHFAGTVSKTGYKKLKDGNFSLIVNIKDATGAYWGSIKFPSVYYDKASDVISAYATQVRPGAGASTNWGITIANDCTVAGKVVAGGGSGSTVGWTQIVSAGTKIAEVSIDGTTTEVFAPGIKQIAIEAVSSASPDTTFTGTKAVTAQERLELFSGQATLLISLKTSANVTQIISFANLSKLDADNAIISFIASDFGTTPKDIRYDGTLTYDSTNFVLSFTITQIADKTRVETSTSEQTGADTVKALKVDDTWHNIGGGGEVEYLDLTATYDVMNDEINCAQITLTESQLNKMKGGKLGFRVELTPSGYYSDKIYLVGGPCIYLKEFNTYSFMSQNVTLASSTPILILWAFSGQPTDTYKIAFTGTPRAEGPANTWYKGYTANASVVATPGEYTTDVSDPTGADSKSAMFDFLKGGKASIIAEIPIGTAPNISLVKVAFPFFQGNTMAGGSEVVRGYGWGIDTTTGKWVRYCGEILYDSTPTPQTLKIKWKIDEHIVFKTSAAAGATEIEGVSVEGTEYKFKGGGGSSVEYVELSATADSETHFLGDITSEQASKLLERKHPIRLTLTVPGTTPTNYKGIISSYTFNHSETQLFFKTFLGNVATYKELIYEGTVRLAQTTGAIEVEQFDYVEAKTTAEETATGIEGMNLNGVEYKFIDKDKLPVVEIALTEASPADPDRMIGTLTSAQVTAIQEKAIVRLTWMRDSTPFNALLFVKNSINDAKAYGSVVMTDVAGESNETWTLVIDTNHSDCEFKKDYRAPVALRSTSLGDMTLNSANTEFSGTIDDSTFQDAVKTCIVNMAVKTPVGAANPAIRNVFAASCVNDDDLQTFYGMFEMGGIDDHEEPEIWYFKVEGDSPNDATVSGFKLNWSSRLIDLESTVGEHTGDINFLKTYGRCLGVWSCATGKPMGTSLIETGFAYNYNDYFIIGELGGTPETTYMPSGSEYTGAASTTVDEHAAERGIGDFYYYDNGGPWVSSKPLGHYLEYGKIAGDPNDSPKLKAILTGKASVTDLEALEDEVEAINTKGRLLGNWNDVTGQAHNPAIAAGFVYDDGDYFIVETLGTTQQLMPYGTSYSETASTTVYSGTETVALGDYWVFGAGTWHLEHAHSFFVHFKNIAGSPVDNPKLMKEIPKGLDDIATGTEDPSGGSDGDWYFQYEA